MRSLLVVLGSGLVLVAASCGGSDQSAEVIGVPWRWSGVLEGEGTTGLSRIPDPENYLLRLDEDESFIGKADCKSLAGTYSLSGDELVLDLGPTPNVACGPNSLSEKYVDLLGKVRTYEVYEEGALALGLQDGSGYTYFYVSAE